MPVDALSTYPPGWQAAQRVVEAQIAHAPAEGQRMPEGGGGGAGVGGVGPGGGGGVGGGGGGGGVGGGGVGPGGGVPLQAAVLTDSVTWFCRMFWPLLVDDDDLMTMVEG